MTNRVIEQLRTLEIISNVADFRVTPANVPRSFDAVLNMDIVETLRHIFSQYFIRGFLKSFPPIFLYAFENCIAY